MTATGRKPSCDRGTLMIGPAMVEWARANIAALDVEHCGDTGHFCIEDQPLAIATAIAGWADRHRLR